MKVRLVFAAFLLAGASCFCLVQAPAGRWDGTARFGELKVPFRVDFEGDASHLKAAFVNGDARVASSSASFSDGKVVVAFANGAKIEAALADGELKGSINGAVPFTASAFCSCGYEGEAGPDISGVWEVDANRWRMEVRRMGEDTFATIRQGGEGAEVLGPLAGRFDGLSFSLHYFDGKRAGVLEIEPRKGGGLDLSWTEPGAVARKMSARRLADL